MKILYGVQGTGNGHITRARIMARAFADRSDVEVDFIFSGREPDKYFDMQVFGDYKTYQGLSFATHQGAIAYAKTIQELRPKQFLKDVKSLNLSGYDLLLNDFEPITAWAARQQKIPSISISHQAAFSHPIPSEGVSIIDRLITRYFAPTSIQLGVHWYHFGFPILPPFIDDKASQNESDKSILVYLPFEDVEQVQGILETFAEHDFVCFHPHIKSAYKQSNLSWHPTAKEPFKAALAKCKGVIANAGFEMASESIHLSKKLLIKPLSGQFEQLSNASTLADIGLGQVMARFDLEVIEHWLQAPSVEGVQFKSDPHILIDWLLKKQWSDTQGLCASLWEQVAFPPAIQQSLNRLSC